MVTRLEFKSYFHFLRKTSSLVSFDMMRVILKMRPKMALIDPSPFKNRSADLDELIKKWQSYA